MCFGARFVYCVLCTVVSSAWGGNTPGIQFYINLLLNMSYHMYVDQ